MNDNKSRRQNYKTYQGDKIDAKEKGKDDKRLFI